MTPLELLEAFRTLTKDLLQKAKPAARCTEVLRKVNARADAASAAMVGARAIKLACREGCSFCCRHLKVDAHAHEILYAAEHIRAHLDTEQIAGIVARSRAHAEALAPMTLPEQIHSRQPCPLLVDDRCIAHEARPRSCRNHHATDVKLCEESFNKSDPTLPGTEDGQLKSFGSIVWIAVKRAFVEEGYDAETYEFGSAIGEALENPATARRWRDKKRAFSAAVRAKDSEQMLEMDNRLAEVIRRNQATR